MLILLAWLLIFFGLFFIFTALIGSVRMPDFYTKIHAFGISDSFGVPLTLLGLCLLQQNLIHSIKIILIIVLMMILTPLSTHLIAKTLITNSDKDKQK